MIDDSDDDHDGDDDDDDDYHNYHNRCSTPMGKCLPQIFSKHTQYMYHIQSRVTMIDRR
jgi:hypothetical protein